MPKRLSDLTHQYERTAEDLEAAEDALTEAVEQARVRVTNASTAHRTISSELLAYLREHPDEIVVAGDWGYHYDPHSPGSICSRPIFWAHHIWVEESPEGRGDVQNNTYRVPAGTLAALATAWGDVEPEPAADDEPYEHPPFAALIGIPDPRAGEPIE